jgi:hypothetical protein
MKQVTEIIKLLEKADKELRGIRQIGLSDQSYYRKAAEYLENALATLKDINRDCFNPGIISLKQYAAIHLKVPRSGDEGIDAMIRESRRADFAEKVIQDTLPDEFYFDDYVRVPMLVKRAFVVADAMHAEWEKEEEK